MADKLTGKTSSGFSFEIDNAVFSDMIFFDALRTLTEGDNQEQINAGLDLVKALFNDKSEEKRFYDFIKSKNGGRAPVEAVGQEIGEIMKILKETSKEAKN